MSDDGASQAMPQDVSGGDEDTANAADAAPALATAAAPAPAVAADSILAASQPEARRKRGPNRLLGKRVFVLDLVRHATATDTPLSGGLAGCKMRNFQRPSRGSAASGYPGTYGDTDSHIGIS
jgi:hypothetical protein